MSDEHEEPEDVAAWRDRQPLTDRDRDMVERDMYALAKKRVETWFDDDVALGSSIRVLRAQAPRIHTIIRTLVTDSFQGKDGAPPATVGDLRDNLMNRMVAAHDQFGKLPGLDIVGQAHLIGLCSALVEDIHTQIPIFRANARSGHPSNPGEGTGPLSAGF